MKTIFQKVFFLFSLGWLMLSPCQAEHLPVKIYTSADGLGSSFVDYLMRDSRGFMWFCTRDGLSRFDGAHFVTYQVGDKKTPPGIESIYESRDGTYWISTTGGLYRFNPIEVSQTDSTTPRLNAEQVSQRRGRLFEDRNGNLWMTFGNLSLVKQLDGKVIFENFDLGIPHNQEKFAVNYSLESPDGSLWFYTTAGIVRILPNSKKVFYQFDNSLNSLNTTIMGDAQGNIWFTLRNLLYVIKPESADTLADAEQITIKSIEKKSVIELKPEGNFRLPQNEGEIVQFTDSANDDFLDKSFFKRLFQTSDGVVWVTGENYLLEFNKGNFRLHSQKEGLPSVMALMAEDAAGNLWISGQAGLGRLDRNGMITFSTDDGANSSRFFAINESTDGKLYFATQDHYVNRLDGNKLISVRPNIPKNSAVVWTSRFEFVDSNNNWWFLTSDKLYRFDNVKNIEDLPNSAPTKIFSTENGLLSNVIFQMFEDSRGDIWVTTRDDTGGEKTGTLRLKKGETKFQSFSEENGLPKSKSFSSATEDLQGNIWFSFYNGGVARFDGNKFQFWGANEGFTDGVAPAIHADKKGRLWIGTALFGLFRVDDTTSPNPVFLNLTTDNGISSNNIRTITEDNFGRIYLGTARGVDRITPESGQIKNYSVNDGLAADFVVDSHRDKKGILWFATNDGVSKLTPISDEKNSAPRILIGGLRIAGEPQPISQLGSAEINKGELSANQNNLQIDFFGLDYRAGETLRYQYKFENDENWSAPTEQRTVNFANLSPNNYKFLVLAINSEGLTSENPAVVTFKILPPLYARWWFILLSIFLFSGGVYGFYRYRLAKLEQINFALQEAKKAEENLSHSRAERIVELERVRSRIATDLHDDIGASLTQIAILSEVAQAQSKGNGATESLTKISNVSNELVGTMSDIVWAINPSKDHLHDLTQRMRRFASDSLSAKGILFHFEYSEANQEVVVKSNLRREVFLIFKESINNILKHSEAKKVEIELKISNRDLRLKITDDGKGFEAEKAYENSLSSISMGRNGVLSMQKRAEEMGGELELISEIGRGTTIKLNLPMEQKIEI